jgi:hypothetical protein
MNATSNNLAAQLAAQNNFNNSGVGSGIGSGVGLISTGTGLTPLPDYNSMFSSGTKGIGSNIGGGTSFTPATDGLIGGSGTGLGWYTPSTTISGNFPIGGGLNYGGGSFGTGYSSGYSGGGYGSGLGGVGGFMGGGSFGLSFMNKGGAVKKKALNLTRRILEN